MINTCLLFHGLKVKKFCFFFEIEFFKYFLKVLNSAYLKLKISLIRLITNEILNEIKVQCL